MEILEKNKTRERLSYLFGVEGVGHYKNSLINSLINLVKKPHLTDRILKNFTMLGSGMFGTAKKANLDLELVVKDNKRYIEDVNEIFINQARVNDDVIKRNNPNFPIMYSYILSKPKRDDKDRICTDDIIDISSYTVKNINTLLAKKKLKLYGIYEYIQGKTLASFITSLKFIRLTEKEKWSLLKSILIQVFSGLDKLSQSGKYTHFDLHTGNVMISMMNTNHTYTLTGGEEKNVNDNFRAFIIDQGLSNIEYDGKFFVYQRTFIPFMPVYDIYKLLSTLYLSLANFDNQSKDYFHVKKLELLILDIFGNDESIIHYINAKPKGDIITFMYHSGNDYIKEIVKNMPYSDLVLLLLSDQE